MIQSRPKLKNKKLVYIALFLLVAAILMFPTSRFAGKYAFVLQFAGFAMAAASLFILVKYVLTDYLYTLENGHFTIHKINGSRSICVADIEFQDMLPELMSKEKYKKDETVRKVYTFIKNPGSENLRYLVCLLGTNDCAVLFEPDSLFEKEFSAQLKEYKNSLPQEEDEDDE